MMFPMRRQLHPPPTKGVRDEEDKDEEDDTKDDARVKGDQEDDDHLRL